jgi:hypothetical protein
MAQKMLSCICGNTDLEKVGVNLLRSNDAESLELTALLCRGNGCGRVTFRPSEAQAGETTPDHNHSAEAGTDNMPKTKPDAPKQSRESLKKFIALFEQVYTERLVYKAIAERDPGCAALFEALKSDDKIRERITRTFTPVYESIERGEDFVKLLEALPSTGNRAVEKQPAAVARNGH